MIQTFALAPTNPILATPATAGGFYARSGNAADTGDLILTGPVSGTPTAETLALTGQRERLFAGIFSTLSFATLSAAQVGTVSIYGTGTAGNGRVLALTQPANDSTLTIGLTGFTQAYTFKTSLTGAAYEVLRGADATASMVNLRRAIRDGDAVRGDGTGEGTLYGTGTAANPYQDITAISGTILTTTDLIAGARSLAWSYAQSAAAFSLQAPIGGTDGTLLASIQAGNTIAANAITLDDDALTAERLPALLAFTSDWIPLQGRGASLYLQSENVTTAMVTSYEIATATGYPIAGSEAIASMDNNEQVINIPERANFLRVKINNTNTTPSSVNAKIVAG